MSDQPNPSYYYADTAYKPAKRVAWEEANPDRQCTSGSRLTWYRRTQDNGSKDEYGYDNLAISANWESDKNKLGPEENIFSVIKVKYDHQSIMPPHYSFLSKCMYILMAFGMFFFFLFFCGFFFLSIVALGHWVVGGESYGDFKSSLSIAASLCFPVALISLFFWKAGRFLEKKFPRFFYGMRKAPLWQLNRQNGFFTIYNPKKAWEERLSAPFYEFDAYLESSPDTQGSPTYSLMLYHPETGLRQKLDAQFPPTNMPGELVAAWQFIQRYMDVSQPLPDVPALEIHRYKDPATAAADQRKGRNPRYWRDMSEEDVEKIQEEKYRKNIRLR
ncbi:hypothetical protein [Halomonas sp. hl-4]|uniref:hypothetical protein n=1 Tax=Halomonas sp. hl-4 TaxID=1761789 RepID=UPI000BB79676|nr:hypothetical protein [Halomonas sp. hl-4]SNY95731.1 hypothetical protein SAMN04488142_0239 [Halomonas sp. hl-4]